MVENVKNVETYLKQLPRLSEKMSGTIFYRGQSDVDYKLTPYILRGVKKAHEHEIYVQIMTECAHEFDDCNLHNEILSKMQHYGVPTRLLDITTNALVALYFACQGNQANDGAVYVMKPDKSKIKQYDSDAISILACLPRFNMQEKDDIKSLAVAASEKIKNINGNDNEVDELIKIFNEQKIIRRLLHEIKKEKPAFENIINPIDILSNYFFIPRKVNARIIRQSGAFIIFGLGINEIGINRDYSDSTDRSYDKIIIDRDKKQVITDQLSCFGISKASLHPELYKVAEYIKEKY